MRKDIFAAAIIAATSLVNAKTLQEAQKDLKTRVDNQIAMMRGQDHELIDVSDVVDDKIMYSYSYSYSYYYYNYNYSYKPYDYGYYSYSYYSGATTAGPMALALLVPGILATLM